MDISSPVGPPHPTVGTNTAALREATVALEATFLNEMLKAARFGEPRSAFGGGEGEAQFSSFLRQEHARALAENGGIGLAESIFNVMKDRIND
ncbi:flagellar biosynthesis protein FlgJ [Salipiger aestuarii]|uniref:Rod binding protein n=1 Tax=Salipiger aestuarii TaxID=568098 RepID=A0A327Y2K9_9RHOB|nr:rod-binding protein [Salipiger aestuarii]EIE51603.1 flagellar protein FlgJ, putative [Citreicella sp. 357]KAA8606733.1 flagellar biosynthesis protein FlgJ [Salipiger aestuarii]KAA8610586.1 flagellar biosynthesis protein FlgJ [Salipiger aestuarii]KAB2541349.1 flagellar biosynthesis protein FlgJ [Salipiger aestuarii]RAK13985.1 rod binding protein [Salipiger aestuarii]